MNDTYRGSGREGDVDALGFESRCELGACIVSMLSASRAAIPA